VRPGEQQEVQHRGDDGEQDYRERERQYGTAGDVVRRRLREDQTSHVRLLLDAKFTVI
jgi:hypothetical protein